MWPQGVAGGSLAIPRHVLAAQVLHCLPLDMGGLVLKMEQKPQLKARIGNREMNCVRLGLLFGLWHEWVFIDVEHAPDAVIAQVVTLTASGFALGLFLPLHRSPDNGSGNAADHRAHRRSGIVLALPEKTGSLRTQNATA
jgi:hypothetical protein